MPRINNEVILWIWLKICATHLLRRYQPGMRERASVVARRTRLIRGIIDRGNS